MDEDDPIRIDTEGITVTKRYEPDDFAVPTISFEIRSIRKQPGRIRLEERVPDEFPIKGIGFHPDYDSERWTAHAEGRLVFESRIEPETTLITVYGIRIEDDEEASEFMNEPELTVRGIESAGSAHSDSMEIVADGAGDAIPVPVSHVTTVGAESTTTETAGVGATLAAELRAGTLSDADRATLANALFETESESESERVQLAHLQSRVSELEAYTEAFESFLDDNGTGEQLVAELQGGLRELRGEVESIDSSIDEALAKQTEGIDALESDLDAMEATLGNHDDLAADIDAVSDDLDAIYEEVDELRTWREQLGVAFGGE